MNVNDEIARTIAEVDWSKAYQYKALVDAEKLLRDELDRRRGAAGRWNYQSDPSQIHFEALYHEIKERTHRLYREAYMKETIREEANPDRSGGEAPTDVAGR